MQLFDNNLLKLESITGATVINVLVDFMAKMDIFLDDMRILIEDLD